MKHLLFLAVLLAAIVLGGRWLARTAAARGGMPIGYGGRTP